ncbi:hypothetical protein IAR55_006512 [Kwoniella newhampshirensis]|uniref:TauD/TfdA-like domain-containing protein n=1 Tax=Kwoniella newhampshirensis TaxID=1651941 RepID=A0AAW0YIU7_9TREE
MAHIGSSSLLRVLPHPSRCTSSLTTNPPILQTRYQSGSSESRLHPRPRLPRSDIASFAVGSDLLTPPIKAPVSRPLGPDTTRPVSRPSSLPRPVLKANPYAGNYTVTEADLEDTEDNTVVSPGQPSPSLRAPIPQHRRPPFGQRRPHVAAKPSGAQHVFHFTPVESVSIHSDYITYTHEGETSVISTTRLYDNCTCPRCRDKSTKQKSTTALDAISASANPSFRKARHKHTGKHGLLVDWSPESRHASFFPTWVLRAMSDPLHAERIYRTPSFLRQTWGAETLSHSRLRVPFNEMQSSLLQVLEQLQVYGIVVIEGVPTNPTSDQDCMLRKVVGLIGEIRNTFYGETWDVKSVKQSKNVAYTDQDLGLHMDLLYFSSPPRFQALHCLRNRVNGGMSYFVDSFRVAIDLPAPLFETLQHHRIGYIYDNDNHFLRYQHPVISPQFSLANPHSAVNWSPPFRAGTGPLAMPTKDPALAAREELRIYRAVADFERRLADPRYRYQFTMREGDLVMFDNRRVLHARTAFSDKTEEERERESVELVEGEPTRWLKGCYLDGEVVWDKLAVLQRQLSDVKKVTAGST